MKRRYEDKIEAALPGAASAVRGEKGFVLVIALLIMTVLAVIGAAILTTSTMDTRISGNVVKSKQALLVSESGISSAINYLRTNPSWGPNNNDKSVNNDYAQTWAAQSQGTVALNGGINGAYSIAVYDKIGSNGRLNNTSRTDFKYADLGSEDVLLEVTGTVSGVSRKIGLIVRTKISAFDYATYSDDQLNGTGAGNNPGTFIGKLYAGGNLNLQGNYNTTQAQAEAQGNITPNCSSGKFQSCNDNASEVTAPVLDFSYYQDQANFSTQQVYTMTPTVGSTSSCGASCTQWPINYAMTTLGTSYTIKATAQAVKSGSNYNHTVYWCTDPNWNGVIGSCSGTQSTYTYTSDKAESTKPFINALQFNSYTAPTNAAYSSSVVNVFDAAKHLEFLGPPAGQSATVTASILVGTAANNSEPVGKIDIEGGAGTLNFQPANGLAIVAEKVEFKAKYSSINTNIGTASEGAVIIATSEFEVEASAGNVANFSMNGSIVAGDGASTGEFGIGGNGVNANFTYAKVNNLPQGWQNYGSITVTRREWREL